MRIRVFRRSTSNLAQSLVFTFLLFLVVGFIKQQRYFLRTISQLSETELLGIDTHNDLVIRKAKTPVHKCVIRNATVTMPMAPHFIIIGAQKAGTSYLVDVLKQHPNLIHASEDGTKELHFLDWKIESRADKRLALIEKLHLNNEEELWCHFRKDYSSKFNTSLLMQFPSLKAFEKTPSYLFHGYYLPPLVEKVCPWKPKLLAILRNPIERAWSHYNMDITQNPRVRPYSFESFLEKELDVMRQVGLTNASLWNDTSFELPLLSQRGLDLAHKTVFRRVFLNNYLQRGMYAVHLQKWKQVFGDGLMVLKYEDLYGESAQTYYDSILRFLGVP